MPISPTAGRYDSALKFLAAATAANEASIWLPSADGKMLVMAHNPFRGTNAAAPTQPLSEGLISSVYLTGQPREDTGIFPDVLASKRVDEQLHQQTIALMAAPLQAGGKTVGVVTIVQIVDRHHVPKKWGFVTGAAELLQLAARMIESI